MTNEDAATVLHILRDTDEDVRQDVLLGLARRQGPSIRNLAHYARRAALYAQREQYRRYPSARHLQFAADPKTGEIVVDRCVASARSPATQLARAEARERLGRLPLFLLLSAAGLWPDASSAAMKSRRYRAIQTARRRMNREDSLERA